MNVLSLFDGMSCGQLALNRIGMKPKKYFASEVDKYGIKVTKKNFPETIHIGDVRDVDPDKLPKIDLLIGGSPCQNFSFAGKRKGMSTKEGRTILDLDHYLELKSEGFEFEGQSFLFWEYVRILRALRKKNPNIKFLLENVVMSKDWEWVISKQFDIHPIKINSALVSAQNRNRLYWTNIGLVSDGLFGDMKCGIKQPKDKGILLEDVLEIHVDDKYFLSDKALSTIKKHGADKHLKNEKSNCLLAGYYKQGGRDQQYIVHNMQPRSGDPKKGGTGHLTREDGKTYCLDTGNTNAVEIREVKQLNSSDESQGRQAFQQNRVYDSKGISPSLDTDSRKNVIDGNRIRKLTPIECERLQTVPDNYTNYVSDTQRYKMLGNGWTVDVICHILSYLE